MTVPSKRMQGGSTTRLLTAVLFVLLLRQSAAIAADCNELLRLGYSNVHVATSQHDSLTAAYRTFCSGANNYAQQTDETKIQVGIAFDVLKKQNFGQTKVNFDLGFGSTSSAIQEAYNQFCGADKTSSQYSDFTSSSSSQISDSALAAWSRCLALNKKGMQVDIRRAGADLGVTVDLHQAEGAPNRFNGIDQQAEVGTAKCLVSGKGFHWHRVKDFDDIELSSVPITISCGRNGVFLPDGTWTAEATRLTFKTSAGSFDVDFPKTTIAQPARRALSAIQSGLSSKEAKLRLSYGVTLEQKFPNLEYRVVNFDKQQFDNSFALFGEASVVVGPDWSFTVPRDGIYLISAAVRGLKTPDLGGPAYAFVELQVNGMSALLITETGSNTADPGVPFLQQLPIGTAARFLKANDVVRVVAYVSAASDWVVRQNTIGEDFSFINISEL